jgi:hypothetical protein
MWALVIAGVFAYALAAIAGEPLRINGDSALHIQAAERILQGGLAHVDAIDTNPPLIMYLTALPTAVAHATGSHPVPVFLLSVWLFTVASTFATRQLLLSALSPREAIHADLLGVSVALASYVLLVRDEYGQREHLFVFGVLPYLIVRFRAWERIPTPRGVVIGAGLVAGLAASIKPQLALIVLAPEIYWLLTRRTFLPLLRSEIGAAAAIAAAYLAHFLFVPKVGEAFFGRWVPLLVKGFGAYNGTLESILLWHYAEWQLAAIALVALALRAKPADVAWRLTRPLAAATMAAVAVYILQRKGWTYHAVPILVLAYALAGLIVAQLFTPAHERESESPLTSAIPLRLIRLAIVGAVAVTIAGSLLAIGPSTRSQLERLQAESSLAREITAHTQQGEPVLLLSTNAWDPYPLLAQLRRPQASRFLFAFPVALFHYGAPSQAEETRFLDELKDDIEANRPKLVMIDVKQPCMACPDGFSLHDYFARTAFVADAMAEYSRSTNVDHYAVYLRKN